MTKTIYIQNWVFFFSTLRLKFLMISFSIWFIFGSFVAALISVARPVVLVHTLSQGDQRKNLYNVCGF